MKGTGKGAGVSSAIFITPLKKFSSAGKSQDIKIYFSVNIFAS
jgi:hypothetical protein